jgi:hypothetical protein
LIEKNRRWLRDRGHDPADELAKSAVVFLVYSRALGGAVGFGVRPNSS